MKITELRCSACQGTMIVDPENPNYAVCEYCGTRYLIEWDTAGGDRAAGEGNPSLKKVPEPIQYKPIPFLLHEKKKTGWEPYGWKRGVAIGALFLVILGVIKGPAVYRRYKMDHEAKVNSEQSVDAANGSAAGVGKTTEDDVKLEGVLAAFAEQVFGQPAELIPDEQLAKIQWLEFRTTVDFEQIGYSFHNPYADSGSGSADGESGVSEPVLTWVSFPRDNYADMSLSSLPKFTGVKKLKTNRGLTSEEIAGLHLEGITGYFNSLDSVAGLIGDTASIREIGMSGDTVSINGAEKFPNLEILSLDCDQIEEPKKLVAVKTLKSLSVDLYDEGMDFSVFGMMPWLERITISSKKLKDFSFVSGMNGLKELNLSYGTFLNLDPLKDCAGLESLTIERCDELKDMSALSGLTKLKKMKLELPYGCPEPDLSALTAMEELYLDSFENTAFLRYMPELTTMTLDSCRINNPSDFEGLTKLTTLNCTSFGQMERDYRFITRLPALENLNLSGTKTYEDISGIFNMPALKSLNISGMECEINFNNIQDNTSLEQLKIDHIKLYKNVSVRGGGGIYSVNWDDVNLTDHLSFLGKFKGLNALSIKENELTDLGFVSSMEALKSIDFSDNYVTDISPLSGLKGLREVICTENPISNFEVLGDSVMVVQ